MAWQVDTKRGELKGEHGGIPGVGILCPPMEEDHFWGGRSPLDGTDDPAVGEARANALYRWLLGEGNPKVRGVLGKKAELLIGDSIHAAPQGVVATLSNVPLAA